MNCEECKKELDDIRVEINVPDSTEKVIICKECFDENFEDIGGMN